MSLPKKERDSGFFIAGITDLTAPIEGEKKVV